MNNMAKYLLRHKNGEEFLLHAYDTQHAKANANYYDAVVVGKLHTVCQGTDFVNDTSCDWSKHTTK